jgi:hypothetical protein
MPVEGHSGGWENKTGWCPSPGIALMGPFQERVHVEAEDLKTLTPPTHRGQSAPQFKDTAPGSLQTPGLPCRPDLQTGFAPTALRKGREAEEKQRWEKMNDVRKQDKKNKQSF